MLTLYVDGIPSIKLRDMTEIPPKKGKESWRVVDAEGNIVAAYR